ncbi:MAG: MFS transporter [Sinobacteraceae bacterium]|nr:MFS transporter [Nevskiaceae bacterium]
MQWTAWLALLSAGLAWLFDAMDFQIFTLILFPSVSALIGSADPGRVAATGGAVIACKMLGWGVGGIAFGVLADRIGRARTMMTTVLIYAAFTGLSGLARSVGQLSVMQALAGLGMGGEWAAGTALVAETWPERSRARAMQVMQMCFALGFFAAAAVNVAVGPYGWRFVFLAGVLPGPVVLLLRLFVPEPPRWLAVRNTWGSTGALTTLRALFAIDMRGRTFVGVLIALTMMIGSNSLSPLIPVWIHQLLPPERQGSAGRVISQFIMLVSLGGMAGYLGLMLPNARLGRRWAYTLIVASTATVVLLLFSVFPSIGGLLIFAPIYGFFTIGGFGFFAMYFPELFPTRLRATGQGFCWNTARTLAAAGPLVAGTLVRALGSVPAAGRLIAAVYLIGLIAIWFGPETKGQALQD